MTGEIRPDPLVSSEPACDPRPGRAYSSGWLAIPLAIFGVGITLLLLAWVLRPFGGPPGGFPFFWPFFPFGFLFLFFVVFWVFRGARWGPGWGWGYRGYYGGRESPREILRRRYARGEIGPDQYREMLRTLEQSE